jgi:AcrR family transcriptional regulator
MSCGAGCLVCERLRGAALEIVGEGGIEALSQERLADRLGMTAEQVCRHYATSSACIYDTYDELACDVLRDMVDAFAQGDDWQAGFDLSRHRLLERMAAHPAQARLCFVETTRGDRELRRRRDITRRWIVEFLQREHERRNHGEPMPVMQLEMLIGAGFQTISSAVADGDTADLSELEPKLAQVAGFFISERV